MENKQDFTIENGILTKYTGTDKHVEIPAGVTEIGEKAFHKCAKVISVTIPESVKAIGVSAFQGCKKLEDINWPENVKVIENNTFWGCSALKSLTLPPTLKVIRKGAFRNCYALEQINLPEGLREIGWSAFDHCNALKQLTLPASLNGINSGALHGCCLETLTLAGETSIYQNREGWFHAEVIYAPNKKLSYIEEPEKKHAAVLGLARLREQGQALGEGVWEDALSYIRRQRKALYPLALAHGEVLRLMTAEKVIPQEDCAALVEQASDVEAKARLLEYQHQNFQPVDPVKEMEKEFKAMERAAKQLEKFQETGMLPAAMAKPLWKYDGDGYQAETIHIKRYTGQDVHVTIPKGIGKRMVSAILDRAFQDCPELESVVIWDGIQEIGARHSYTSGVFQNCRKLLRVQIPASVTFIAPNAFLACSSLKQWDVHPENPVYRGQDGMLLEKKGVLVAYPSASGEVVLPDGLTAIGESAFAHSALTGIHIPDSVTSTGDRVFDRCEELQEVRLPAGMDVIEYRTFGGCTNLRHIEIPAAVTRISDSAFSSCKSLSQVIIPEGVCTISETAFANCIGLTSITLPGTLTWMGRGVFLNCPNLTVRAPAGSYAEQYAQENNIKFEAL